MARTIDVLVWQSIRVGSDTIAKVNVSCGHDDGDCNHDCNQYMPQELPGESDVDQPNVKWFGMRHVADEEL